MESLAIFPTEEFSGKLRTLSKFIDQVLRGDTKSVNSSETWQQALELFDFSSSTQISELANGISETTKADLATAAIKLHNKSRNLPIEFVKFKSIARVCAAWIILHFSKRTSKSTLIVIKILASAVSDIDNATRALRCHEGIISCWDHLNDCNMIESLSSIELQECKIVTFKSLLAQSQIALDMRIPESFAIAKRSFARALDMSMTLAVPMVILLCENSINMGINVASMPMLLPESVYYFVTATNTLTYLLSKSQKEGLSASNEETVTKLFAKASLSLAYVHMESNENDKALGCIHNLESQKVDLSALNVTIAYAKFTISVKDKNWQYADRFMKVLVNSSSVFDMVLDSLKLYISQAGAARDESICNFFQMIALKFPMEPYFSELRLCQAQYLISTQEKDFQKSLELCHSIAIDHCSAERCLSSEQFKSFTKLLQDRTEWFRARSQWSFVLVWCDIAILLTRNMDSMAFDQSYYEILKAEALVNTGNYSEAFSVAMDSYKKNKLSRNATSVFRAALFHFDSKLEAVKLFLEINSNVDNNTKVDRLMRIVQCYDIASSSNISTNEDVRYVKVRLLKTWLMDAVKLDIGEIHEKNLGLSLVSACNLYLQELFGLIFECTQQLNKQIEESNNLAMDIEDISENQRESQQENMVAKIDEETVSICKKMLFPSSFDFRSYVLKVSLQEIREFVTGVIQPVCDILTSVPKCTLDKLGAQEEIEWLGDVIWNFASLICRDDVCKIETIPTYEPGERKLLAALLFELSGRVYSTLQEADMQILLRNQSMCMIVAAAARIECVGEKLRQQKSAHIDEINILLDKDASHPSKQEFVPILQAAATLSEAALKLLHSVDGFHDDDQIRHLKKLSLYIQFCALVKIRSMQVDTTIDKLITSLISNQVDLTVEDLIECAYSASDEPNIPCEVVRDIFQLALQQCAREDKTNYHMMGYIYRKLIETSPNRDFTFEKIEDFRQLVEMKSGTSEDLSSEFMVSEEDIDHVCAVAYNYGITLVDLGQSTMAEKFVKQAISLLKFASKTLMNEWSDRMQDAYHYALRVKSVESKPYILSDMMSLNVKTNQEIKSAADTPIEKDIMVPQDIVSAHE